MIVINLNSLEHFCPVAASPITYLITWLHSIKDSIIHCVTWFCRTQQQTKRPGPLALSPRAPRFKVFVQRPVGASLFSTASHSVPFFFYFSEKGAWKPTIFHTKADVEEERGGEIVLKRLDYNGLKAMTAPAKFLGRQSYNYMVGATINSGFGWKFLANRANGPELEEITNRCLFSVWITKMINLVKTISLYS